MRDGALMVGWRLCISQVNPEALPHQQWHWHTGGAPGYRMDKPIPTGTFSRVPSSEATTWVFARYADSLCRLQFFPWFGWRYNKAQGVTAFKGTLPPGREKCLYEPSWRVMSDFQSSSLISKIVRLIEGNTIAHFGGKELNSKVHIKQH